MQSKKNSLIEVATNTGVGLVGAWLITYYTMKLVTDLDTAVTLSVSLCTVWSLVRGYVIRRIFTRYQA